MGAVTVVLVAAAIIVSTATFADAWKWRKWNLFDDAGGDSVVTVAADGRGVYPVYRTYSGFRTVLLRLPAVPDFGSHVVTRVRHVYSVPPPLPPPPPPATRYGPPATIAPAPSNAASTAAAVAAAVARTILEAHGFSRNIGSSGHHDVAPPTDTRGTWSGRGDAAPYAGEDQGLFWQRRLQQGSGASGALGAAAAASWRR